MNIKIFLSSFVLFFSLISEGKPYNRVAVFSGGGFEFSQFLGMMEALEESQKRPDLIIATCGGGLAAAIIANIPEAKARWEFLQSKEFKTFLRTSKPVAMAENVTSLFAWYMDRNKEAKERLVPAIFSEYLVHIPNALPVPQFEKSFTASPIPIIVIGAKVLFTPAMVGHTIGKKLYREVLFTSPEVGKLLQELQSPIGNWVPQSTIETGVDVVTNLNLLQAARIAITSPFLLPPAQVNGEYYVGGAINLYPLELAHRLGDEVLMSFGDGYGDSGSGQVVQASFQYNPNTRLQEVHEMSASWWVDFSDRDTNLKKKSGLGLKESAMKVSYGMPSDDKVFNQYLLEHFNYGKSRTLEALHQPNKNAKCHVREMDEHNSSWHLRQLCGHKRR